MEVVFDLMKIKMSKEDGRRGFIVVPFVVVGKGERELAEEDRGTTTVKRWLIGHDRHAEAADE